jgi:hypothetical protein
VVPPRVICCDREPKNGPGGHAEIKRDPPVECCHKHVMRQLVPMINIDGIRPCGGFHSCIVNERIALCERHIMPVAVPEQTADLLFARGFELLREQYPVKQLIAMTQSECLQQAAPSRRARMKRAYENLNAHGPQFGWDNVKSFIKWEKFEDRVNDDLRMKAPRLIQHRSDEFCYELARYMKPIEKYVLYRRAGKYCTRRKRIFLKGMNSWEVADNLAHMGDGFANPVWLCLDHSRFDAHLNNAIRSRAREYLADFYRNNTHLLNMLRAMRRNRGRTRHGIRYNVNDTMMSGEYITSLEDCLDNYAILLSFMDFCHILGFECRVNGDDSVICMDASDVDRLDFDFFCKIGFKTKHSLKYDISQVDFCQSYPLRIAGQWRMVRSPKRVLARTAYTCNTYDSDKSWLGLIGAVAACEKACNAGVPILYEWALAMERCAEGHILTREYHELMRSRVREKYIELPITDEARLDFFVAFGISPQQQKQVEKFLKQTNLMYVGGKSLSRG